MRIRKETDCFIDPDPTRVDYPIITEEYLNAYQGERCARPYVPPPRVIRAPAPAPSALPSVTEVEVAALRGVDLVENAVEPINRFNAARAGIKLTAWIARKLR